MKHRVLACGQNAYEHLDTLDWAVSDARSFAGKLKDRAGADVTALDCPSPDSLLQALSDLEEAGGLGKEDTLWFFFAGHGCSIGGKDYLVPGNARSVKSSFFASSCIHLESIVTALPNLGAGLVILCIDACREDILSQSIEFGSEALKLAKEREVVVFFSCDRGERAFENSNGGLFTQALLTSMDQCSGRTIFALQQCLKEELASVCERSSLPKQTLRANVSDLDLGERVILSWKQEAASGVPIIRAEDAAVDTFIDRLDFQHMQLPRDAACEVAFRRVRPDDEFPTHLDKHRYFLSLLRHLAGLPHRPESAPSIEYLICLQDEIGGGDSFHTALNQMAAGMEMKLKTIRDLVAEKDRLAAEAREEKEAPELIVRIIASPYQKPEVKGWLQIGSEQKLIGGPHPCRDHGEIERVVLELVHECYRRLAACGREQNELRLAFILPRAQLGLAVQRFAHSPLDGKDDLLGDSMLGREHPVWVRSFERTYWIEADRFPGDRNRFQKRCQRDGGTEFKSSEVFQITCDCSPRTRLSGLKGSKQACLVLVHCVDTSAKKLGRSVTELLGGLLRQDLPYVAWLDTGAAPDDLSLADHSGDLLKGLSPEIVPLRVHEFRRGELKGEVDEGQQQVGAYFHLLADSTESAAPEEELLDAGAL